jgi:hypothetical protein
MNKTLKKTATKTLALLAKQPEQLELFRLVADQAHTNAFAFYESIPRYVVAR